MTFAEKFEALAARKGKSPRGVALELDFDPSLAAQWKRRGGRPRPELMVKIAGYFAVPQDLLSDDTKELPLVTLNYDRYLADAVGEGGGSLLDDVARIERILSSLTENVARLRKRVEQENADVNAQAVARARQLRDTRKRGSEGDAAATGTA